MWWRRTVLPSLPWVVCFLSFCVCVSQTQVRHRYQKEHSRRQPLRRRRRDRPTWPVALPPSPRKRAQSLARRTPPPEPTLPRCGPPAAGHRGTAARRHPPIPPRRPRCRRLRALFRQQPLPPRRRRNVRKVRLMTAPQVLQVRTGCTTARRADTWDRRSELRRARKVKREGGAYEKLPQSRAWRVWELGHVARRGAARRMCRTRAKRAKTAFQTRCPRRALHLEHSP